MTGLAIIHDADMIKYTGYKARGQMTGTAVIVGWHMVGRRRFSSGGCTVVT